MTPVSLIEKQIQACNLRIECLQMTLEYADGPAYYADLRQINTLKLELSGWEKALTLVSHKEAA